MGGCSDHNRLNLVEKYDPSTKSWSAACAMSQSRNSLCAQSLTLEVNLFDALIARAEVSAQGGGSGRARERV